MHIEQNTHLWIGVDWGTTRIRVFLVNAQGKLCARFESEQGAAHLTPDQFAPVLLDALEVLFSQQADLLSAMPPAQPIPVILCGMVGARYGWCEAPYQKVPCAPICNGVVYPPLASNHPIAQRIKVAIVPGIMQSTPPDVMRGEETQIAGYLDQNPDFNGVLCLPGTHSKWVRITNGTITEFRTLITGDMFASLTKESILRQSIPMSLTTKMDDDFVFLNHVALSLSAPYALLNNLFAIRAKSIIDNTTPEHALQSLSGLLIGAEIAAVRDFWGNKEKIVIIGTDHLTMRYACALSDKNSPIIIDSEVTTIHGLNLARKLTFGDQE